MSSSWLVWAAKAKEFAYAIIASACYLSICSWLTCIFPRVLWYLLLRGRIDGLVSALNDKELFDLFRALSQPPPTVLSLLEGSVVLWPGVSQTSWMPINLFTSALIVAHLLVHATVVLLSLSPSNPSFLTYCKNIPKILLQSVPSFWFVPILHQWSQ